MSRRLNPEQQRLEEIAETQRRLESRAKECAESQRRLNRERIDRERMIPPLSEVLDRSRLREIETLATRGDLKNLRRAQGRSLLLLFLLTCATASMVWWGLQLMRG